MKIHLPSIIYNFNMKILFILFLLFLVIFRHPDPLAQEFEIDFRQTLVIGETDNDSLEYLFSGIRTIRPLSDGRILVADVSDAAMRVYSHNGAFIAKIGRRGRGPGDFQEVTYIETGNNDSLIVVDRMQERISFFDHEGNFSHSRILQSQTLGTLQFVFYRELQNDYLIAYRDYMNADKNGHYLHLYDGSFEIKKSSHLDLFDYFFDPSNSFEIQISIIPQYVASKFGSNQIAVVPKIYTGTVYSIDEFTQSERLMGTQINNYYTLYDIKDSEKHFSSGESGFGSASGQHGRYLYRKKGTTIGLVGNSKFLIHFYLLHQGKNMIPYLTVYSADGEQLTNIPLDNVPLEFIKNNVISIVPHFLDEDNNLYVSDYYYMNSSPAVRVFETNLVELLNN